MTLTDTQVCKLYNQLPVIFVLQSNDPGISLGTHLEKSLDPTSK